MKKLLAVCLALVAFQVLAAPQRAEARMEVNIVLASTSTWSGVTVSSVTPTLLIAANHPWAYTQVGVENKHATLSLFCSENSQVSNTGPAKGSETEPGQMKVYTIKPGQPWYCIFLPHIAGQEISLFKGR